MAARLRYLRNLGANADIAVTCSAGNGSKLPLTARTWLNKRGGKVLRPQAQG
jgi:hypothetical protein